MASAETATARSIRIAIRDQMYPSGTRAWSTQITELVTSLPRLAIARSRDNLVVSWPGTAVAFNLESSSNPSATSDWTRVSQNSSTNNSQIEIHLPVMTGAQYFRLRLP